MENRDENLLIVFLKNPVAGKVKSRLSASIGDQKALNIYLDLINRIREQLRYVSADKAVWYSDFVDMNDLWDNRQCSKYLQQGDDIGRRMQFAIEKSLEMGYTKVVLVGADIVNLSAGILRESFEKLGQNEVVLGPATDGGYYLIGMDQKHPGLFRGIEWSTSKVLKQTIDRCNQDGITYHLLEYLSDIDDVDDLKNLDPRMFKPHSDLPGKE